MFLLDLLRSLTSHLKNGKPITASARRIQKDDKKEELAIVARTKKDKEEEEEFYTQFFLKDGDPLYAGVHGSRAA